MNFNYGGIKFILNWEVCLYFCEAQQAQGHFLLAVTKKIFVAGQYIAYFISFEGIPNEIIFQGPVFYK